MSVFIDTKYLTYLSPKLECFKRVHNDLYNFRCPICGDSKKDQTKARGYVYPDQHNTRLIYKCHNCGSSTTFENILKVVDPSTYKQYTFEKLKEKQSGDTILKYTFNNTEEKLKSTRTIIPNYQDKILNPLTRVDKLSEDHICKQYVMSRKIPASMWPYLYYSDNFKKFVNGFLPGKFSKDSEKFNERRLIIPYFDKHGRVFALQGRALDPKNQIRYFTIKINPNEDISPIYGIDRIKYNKQIYACEGPIDSMFLSNCLAVSGSCYENTFIEQIKTNLIIIPDNERRNKQVSNQIKHMIETGFKVTLWPDGLEFKDINEAILQGYTSEELIEIINSNVVSGLPGRIKFASWVKC